MKKYMFPFYAALLALTAAAVAVHFYDEKMLFAVCGEDGPLESLTAAFYAAAAGFFIAANLRAGFRSVWMWSFAALAFFIAGEEVSWGQRFLGYEVGAIAERNVQHETNLHNLDGIHQHIRLVAVAVLGMLCFVIPWTDRFVPRLRDFYRRLRLPVYPLWTTGLVALSILLMAVPRLVTGHEIYNLDELGETYLSVSYLAFALKTWKQK